MTKTDTKAEPEPEVTPYTRCEQKHYEEIRQQGRKVIELREAAEQAKAIAAAAKKTYEAAVTELGSLSRRSPDAQQVLPFGADKDAWRDLPLTDLTTANALLGPLEKQEFTSIGQLSDWANANGGFSGIEGIGPEKEEQLDDAFVAFWTAHPEFCEAAPEEEEDDDARESKDAAAAQEAPDA